MSVPGPAAVATEHTGPVAVIRLDRPRTLNAVDHALRDGVAAAFAAAGRDPAVRSVVLTGAGVRAFSVGLDMRVSLGLNERTVEGWLRALHASFQSIRELDKPCVAALNGVAMGLGFQLALHCDIRIGHPRVRMSQPEVRAGIPSLLGYAVLERIVGHARAAEISLTAREIDAEEGLRLGLLHEVVPDSEVLPRAIETARAMGELPATAVGLSKAHFRAETQAGFDRALEAAIEMQRIAYRSGEPHAFASAFLARRERR
jgi:enoyl-CoA hydratase/carnithine racemase